MACALCCACHVTTHLSDEIGEAVEGLDFGELAGVGSVGEQIDMTDAAMGGIDVDVAGLDGGVMAVELDKKDRDTPSESDEDDLPQPALARRQDPTQIVQSVAQKSASELGMLI